MPCVGQQGERARVPAAGRFDDQGQQGQREREQQAAFSHALPHLIMAIMVMSGVCVHLLTMRAARGT
jgi:hypothetical protein